MTYRAYNTLVLIVVRLLCVALIAVTLRAPGIPQAEVWIIVASASVVLIGSLFVIGLVVSPTSELTCPDSGEKVVARVKLGVSSGHLYLTSRKES